MKSLECKVLMWLNRSSETLTKAPPVQLLMHHFRTAAGWDIDLNSKSYDLWHQWTYGAGLQTFLTWIFRLLIKGHNETPTACSCGAKSVVQSQPKQRFRVFVFYELKVVFVASGLPVKSDETGPFPLACEQQNAHTDKRALLAPDYISKELRATLLNYYLDKKIHSHTYYCVNIKAAAQSPNQIICFSNLSRNPIQDRNKA